MTTNNPTFELSTDIDIDKIIDINSENKEEYLNTIDDNDAPSYTAMVEGMVIPHYTRNMRMTFAMLSKQGNINMYMMFPLNLHDPQAQRGFENRNFYVAINTNSNKDTSNRTGKTLYRNSNYAMAKHFLTPKINNSNNPFNALLIMDSYVRPAIIPSRITLTLEEIIEINKPAAILKKNISNIKAQGYDDKEVERSLFEESYKLYKTQIKTLFSKGLLTTSQILMAEPNSIKPILTLDSSTSAGSNEFLNVKNLLNGASEMTWIPMLNKVFGGFNLNNEESIQGSDIKLGKIQLAEGLYANAKKATATKYKENIDIVVSVKDNKIDQNRNSKSQSDRLEEAAERQATIFSFGKLVPFVARSGEQGKTNGINQFTIELGQYYQHHSLSQTNSLEFDSLNNIDNIEEINIESKDFSVFDELFDIPSKAEEDKKPEVEKENNINDII